MTTAVGVFREKLDWFKENEKPEAVLVIADDSGLMKVVVAWPAMPVSMRERVSRATGASEHESWQWLWENTEYSAAELAARTGLMEETLARKLRLLIGNRVLYPDGTVNSFVERYLREKVVRLFDAKPKKARARRS